MLIFVVDDEELVLREMAQTIAEAAPEAQVRTFLRADAALDAVWQGARPHVVFTDIQMPGLFGLEFAVRLKQASPNTRIVFATAHEQYAVRAFKVRAHGYLLKPLVAEEVREELADLAPAPSAAPVPNKLVVRCFGHFDVFWQGRPVMFVRRQSKELLAYLVDRRGGTCSSEEVAGALWGSGNTKAAMQRVRNLLSDLKKTLSGIGVEDVLIRERRQMAVRTERLDCDYYRMLAGDMDALNSYRGEYMVDYSWAEVTNANLYFRTHPNAPES